MPKQVSYPQKVVEKRDDGDVLDHRFQSPLDQVRPLIFEDQQLYSCQEEVLDDREKILWLKEEDLKKISDHCTTLSKESEEIAAMIQKHRQKLDLYLQKIAAIETVDKTKRFASVLNKSLSLIERLICRKLEEKLLAKVAGSTVARLYVATEMMKDFNRIMTSDDFCITTYEASADYARELSLEKCDLSFYQMIVGDSVDEIKRMRSTYQQKFANFYQDPIYLENLHKIDAVFAELLEQQQKIKEAVDQYDQVIELNQAKVYVKN